MFEQLKKYFESIKSRDPAATSLLLVLLTYPGVKAVLFHQIAHFFSVAKFNLIARVISQFSRFLTGIEIHPKAKIGKNLFIDHGMGVVIGETSEIESEVSIFQGVTLGGKGFESGKRHPNIKKGASIFAASTVLGDITIGEGAIVAAGSLVLKDVPDNSKIMGYPSINFRDFIRKMEL